jgi:hypothetical protein
LAAAVEALFNASSHAMLTDAVGDNSRTEAPTTLLSSLSSFILSFSFSLSLSSRVAKSDVLVVVVCGGW